MPTGAWRLAYAYWGLVQHCGGRHSCDHIIGTIAMALLVWFSGAKAQQREHEAKEREKETERAVMGRFDELTQLLAKPDTTLEDVRRIVGDQAHFEGVIGLKR